MRNINIAKPGDEVRLIKHDDWSQNHLFVGRIYIVKELSTDSTCHHKMSFYLDNDVCPFNVSRDCFELVEKKKIREFGISKFINETNKMFNI
jgi:hypothetical protein